jgi:hypothetical protein
MPAAYPAQRRATVRSPSGQSHLIAIELESFGNKVGMGKVVFTPVSIISGLLAGLIAAKLFEFIWGQIADEEAPEPEHRDISWPQLIVAMTLEGAIFRLTRGLVNRGTRVAFARATGTWPGEEGPDKR